MGRQVGMRNNPFSNISHCPKCSKVLIAEEFEAHECIKRKKVVDYKIEGNILWLYDGANWYPRKLLKTTDSERRGRNNGGSNRSHLLARRLTDF